MYCPRCKTTVQASKQGHGVRNSIGAIATLGISIKVEPWSCPSCGTECQVIGTAPAAKPSKATARKRSGGAKVEWRCEKNGHVLNRDRQVCPIDGSAAIWRTKP